MNKHKAIFLDRDGTINVEKDYLYKISDFEFLPGVIEALRMLQATGYILIIITNQSGIARGFYTEDDYRILNNWMLEELKKQLSIIVHTIPKQKWRNIESIVIVENRNSVSMKKP